MMLKYEFTGKTIEAFGVTLKQIRRLSDGLVGGYIEGEHNLSHDGACFVLGNAQVFGKAQVSGDAQVFGAAQVSGDARVFDYAMVFEGAQVSGGVQVFETAQVSGAAQISGDAWVFGDARVQKAPVYLSGLKHPITITETHIFIGCEGHPIAYWRRHIKAIGYKHGYTDAEIDKVIKLLKALVPGDI